MTVRLRNSAAIAASAKILFHSCFDWRSVASLLRQCGTLRSVQSIHATMVKTNLVQDSFAMNQFVSACSRLHQIEHAHHLFDEMSEPNTYVYNAVIGGLVQHFDARGAVQLYLRMSRSSSVRPTSYTFLYLTKACSQLSVLALGEALHAQVLKMGFACHIVVQTGLVDFYSSLAKIAQAKQVFDEMSVRDVVSWTAMVSGFVRVGDMASARITFEAMPERCTMTWNTMLAGYARAGDFKTAVSVFDGITCKDLVSWTTMISCYSQNRHFKEAIEVFHGMTATGITPDEVTMATVIAACAHLGAPDLGNELYLYVMLHGFVVDVYLGSALIDMFSKCGNIHRALLVFYKLVDKNLYCWNAIIEGLASHGHANEALNMFHKMTMLAQIEPNSVSFLSALSACAHAGLVEEGRQLFSSMTEDFSIAPGIEHYGCMVDLLARAGLLQGALDLIQHMEVEPNSVIWASLLSSCKIHGDMNIGKMAAKQLLVLEPANRARYMLLVNMYAEAKQWDKVAEVRGMARWGGVEKRGPGCSWIEIDKVVHEFASCDLSHPCHGDIELMLVDLDWQLRISGCSQEMDMIQSL